MGTNAVMLILETEANGKGREVRQSQGGNKVSLEIWQRRRNDDS